MTCAETRDLFSALADDALTPTERAALDAHLAGCADCRRELAGLLRTVKLVRAMDPAQAPAGFVDRVLAAAQPAPWPTRLGRRLRAPGSAVPLSAAALLLIGGLAVLLFRASTDQQRAARYAPPPQPAAPATSSAPAAPDRLAARHVEPTAPTPPDTPATLERPTAPAPPARAADARVEAPRAADKRAGARLEAKGPARDTAEQRASTPREAVDDQRGQANVSERPQAKDDPDRVTKERPPPRAVAKSQATPQSAPLSRTGPMTGIPAAVPDVTAQLRTANVSAAERSLIDLAARMGGRQTGRRIAGGRLIVELAVPRDAYASFVRAVAALGAVAIESQATERPVLAVAVAVSN